MKRFKILEYCEICDEYKELDKEDFGRLLSDILEKTQKEENEKVFNEEKSDMSSFALKMAMDVSRIKYKVDIVNYLYKKEGNKENE